MKNEMIRLPLRETRTSGSPHHVNIFTDAIVAVDERHHKSKITERIFCCITLKNGRDYVIDMPASEVLALIHGKNKLSD